MLKMLLELRIENKPHVHIDAGQGNQVIRSGGYRPMHFFNFICSARDVRMRELRRERLLPISDPPHVFDDAYYMNNGKRIHYSTPQYRIELTPREILALDWSKFWEQPFTAIYDWDSMLIDKDMPRPSGQPTVEPEPVVVYEFDEAVTVNDPDDAYYGQPAKVLFKRGDGQYLLNFFILGEHIPMPVSKIIRTRDFVKEEK